ncbi:2712_t:CDS:2, partial [Cetraspora pellucida]
MTEVIEIDINNTQVANEAKDANSSIYFKEVVNSEVNINNAQTINKTEDANSSICLKEVMNSDLYSTKAFSTWEITPEQVENWIQFSDCVLNDVMHKTNHYGIALSMFVGFNQYWHNILLAQALLSDEITKRQPAVIITNTNPAVDSAVHQHLRNSLGDNYGKFIEAFYVYRNSLAKETFEKRLKNIRQNFPKTNSYMKVLLYIAIRSIGPIASYESVNGCLKWLLHSLNVSLHELINKIYQLLDMQDKKEEYNFWKLAIPCIKSQGKTNFLFKKIDKCLKRIFTSNILQKQCNKINQLIYYEAIKISNNDVKRFCNNEQEIEIHDASVIEMQQALLSELIYLVKGLENVIKIWSVKV